MPTILSTFATSVSNTNSSARAGDVVANRFYVDLKAADLVANNVIDLGILPAGHTVVDATLIADDMDTGAAMTIDVGLMSGTIGDNTSVRTVGQELFAGSTVAQGGTAARASAKTAFTITATGADRSIGAKIAVAPAGAVAGRLKLVVMLAPANSGVAF